MDRLKHWLTIEKKHFNRLTHQAQRLLSSILLYNLIGPIFTFFINAFLWRQSQDLTLVAIYNLSLFIAIPSGFYLNGLLLRKYSPNAIYSVGLLLIGFTVSTLIFLPTITLIIVILFGLMNGIASGLFWSNRNLLTLRATQSSNRIYFTGIESSFKTLTNIIIPLLIGYFIVVGEAVKLYTPIQGYQMIAIIMLLIIGAIGYLMTTFGMPKQTISRLYLKTPGVSWKRFRLYELLFGVLNGSSVFLPVLIVLSLVGQEEKLGTIQSFAAVLTAVIVYSLSKRLDIKHRIPVLALSVLLAIIGAAFLSINYSVLGVFVFFACKALSEPLAWLALNSLNYDLIDKDNKDKRFQYAYVCDQEIYLNIGRIIGIVFFLLLIQFISNDFALRFAPLCFAISQILLVFIAISVEKHHRKTD